MLKSLRIFYLRLKPRLTALEASELLRLCNAAPKVQRAFSEWMIFRDRKRWNVFLLAAAEAMDA
jgi:hypothetical protein